MAFQDAVAAERDGAGTDDSSGGSSAATGSDGLELSPFSMQYDVRQFDVDPEDLNNALTALVAVTNLL